MAAKHIMVLRFSALGDVAMCLPVLRCLIQTYPELRLTVVTQKRFASLFEELANTSVFSTDFDGAHKGIAGLYRLYKTLTEANPKAIADLHNVLRTKILRGYFAPKFWIRKAVLDKGRKAKKQLTRPRQKTLVPLVPQIHRYAQVFERLGFPISLDNHEFPPKPLCPNNEALALDQNKKWIGVAPFAAHKGKQYPLDLMQKVVAFLQQDYQVILFGFGREERAQLDIWAKAYKNVVNATSVYAFNAELRLIAQLDMMISMDSANGHLAANYGLPVISLWGATHPCLGFAPFGQADSNSLAADRKLYPFLPTSVYGNKICRGYEDAMRTIEPKAIVELTLEILDKK
ncbi:MAG: ADP-heptose--LPS heptosyltransferase RfaF [Flavobacteriaceae bacterium]|nr:ADP-heptose--LPS heptosyltransferase RfaF [Flavobacteriaceae bacterium]|tara:strand:+ start:1335 stop:2369 length:1035 start_codon:yes stop_codon:yes gene_type:complete